MDIGDRLIEHDLWLTGRILELAASLPDTVLDEPVAGRAQGLQVVAEPTLRALLTAMVFTKEVWGAGIAGDAVGRPPSLDAEALLRRWRPAAARFRRVVQDIRVRRRWGEVFVRTTWQAPEVFAMGAAVAHVLTFSACRRALALAILQSHGVGSDLGDGDPIDWERGNARSRVFREVT